MPSKKTNFELYLETFWAEFRASGNAPVGADPESEEERRDNGLDTFFWLTPDPDRYWMEDGARDTVVLSPTSFELGLGTPDVNIDTIHNFNVDEGDVITAGDKSVLADTPNRVAVVSATDFFELFAKIGVASNIIVNDIVAAGGVPDNYLELYELAQQLVGQAFADMLAADVADDGEANSLILFSYTDHINTRVGEDGEPEAFADTDAQVTRLNDADEDQSAIEEMLAENGFEMVLNKDATVKELIEFQAPAFVEADFLDPDFFPDGILDSLA